MILFSGFTWDYITCCKITILMIVFVTVTNNNMILDFGV